MAKSSNLKCAAALYAVAGVASAADGNTRFFAVGGAFVMMIWLVATAVDLFSAWRGRCTTELFKGRRQVFCPTCGSPESHDGRRRHVDCGQCTPWTAGSATDT